MLGILLPGNKEVRVLEFPDPKPSPGEILVRIKSSAICRSDMSIYYGTPIVGTGTAIPGHEPSGIVEKIGTDVKHLTEGDRVAIYAIIGCNYCDHCKNGYLMFCPNLRILGFDINGGDAELCVVPERNCLKIPDAMSFNVAALSTDAIGTLFHAAKRAEIAGDDTVAIFGMGPMGSSGLLVSKALGANVICVDTVEDRLRIAKDLGADNIINAQEADPLKEIRDLTNGAGSDVAIDCTGNPIGENNALESAKKHGRVIFIGECREAKIKPSDQLIRKQLTVIGSWYFNISEYNHISELILKKNMPVEKLITHKFRLQDANKAFEMFDQKKTLKVVFTP